MHKHGVSALAVVLGAVCCLLGPSSASAYSLERGSQPIRKLSRGVANTVTGIFEIPVTIQAVTNEEGPVAGMSWGLFLGTGAALTRTGVGLVEILTFPFPLPATGYAPLLRPEFLFQPESTNFDFPRY